MRRLILTAPFAGWVSPLAEVADPAFANELLGRGVAIDPVEGLLRAPCDGEVVHVAQTLHAVTLRTPEGAEILLHVGLDTVALRGEGFTAHVSQGDRVRAGDRLLGFDLDRLAGQARSLMTPVIVIGEDFEVRRFAWGAIEAGAFLIELVGGGETAGPDPTLDAQGVRCSVQVGSSQGLHARPAGRIAAAARGFAAGIKLQTMDGRGANARSSTAVMGLALRFGDAVEVVAHGADADAALGAVGALIASDLDQVPDTPPAPAGSPPSPAVEGTIAGVVAAPGLAIGPAYKLIAADIAIAAVGRGPAVERVALEDARAIARRSLIKGAARETGARRAILEAHLGFLDDPGLVEAAEAAIGRGAGAGAAWRAALREQADALSRLGDARMAERVADLTDVEARVLRALNGESEGSTPIPSGSVLLADELWPSQLIALAPGLIAGFCTAKGGPTSHVAILAAAMELPAVVAAGPQVLEIHDGAIVLLDAEHGRLHPAPSGSDMATARERIGRRGERRASAAAAAADPALTRDGVRIEVFANVGALAEAQAARAAGAEGIGLLRTEYLFLDRPAAPDEAEQAQAYREIAHAMEGRPVIVRTLDIGGDKPAPYLPLPPEENPALGLRGVRVGLWRPEMLKTQLRAILRVRPMGQCRIMLPMITSLAELRDVRLLLNAARAELGIFDPVQLGVMVETPAAAVTADLIAAEADFLSIGTNDLTQYTLALDRGHPQLAGQSDALHPAVLRLIARTCEGAAKHGRWTGVCGGLASEPLAAPILLGLGVTELSCTVSVLAEVKARVRDLDLGQCRDLARKAVDTTSASDVRQLLRAFGDGVRCS